MLASNAPDASRSSGEPSAPRAPGAPRAADIAIAAGTGLVVIAVLLISPSLLADLPEAVTGLPTVASAGWWLVVAVILLQSAALAAVRRAPRTVLVLVCLLPLLVAVPMPGPVFDVTTLAIPVAVFLAFRLPPTRGMWATFLAAAFIAVVAHVCNGLGGEGAVPLLALGEAVVQIGGLLGIPVLLAGTLRARRESREAQRRELRALTRERDALIDAAVARERTAMARELHDIAAHHLSGIVIMASAVERQLEHGPQQARESVSQIRAEGSAVLQNLRQLVGLLRVGDPADRSVENFASVPELVASRSAAEAPLAQLWVLRAELDPPESGPPESDPPEPAPPIGVGVGPLAQLAAYRTIQESLANAAMHAPGAGCLVEIDDTRESEVRVLVRNAASSSPPAPGPVGGFGLLGMRERADLVGAELRYGRTSDGGWEVRLTVPRERSPLPEPGERPPGPEPDERGAP